MITQIVIIVLVLVLLYLLLRHWPETAGERPAWLKPSTGKQPTKETTIDPVAKRLNFNAEETPNMGKRLWYTITHLFSDDRGSLPAAKPSSPAKPATTKPDEFAEFIGVPSKPITAAGDPIDVLISQAEAAERNGRFAEAEKLLVKAASQEPKNAKIFSRLGILYLEQGGNWKEAEESFKQAAKNDPANGFIHNNLGLVLYNQDRYTAAAKEFELALKIDDTIASRHANLGLCYLSLRQYAKAEQEFKRATRLEPKNDEYTELSKEAAAKRRTHRPG